MSTIAPSWERQELRPAPPAYSSSFTQEVNPTRGLPPPYKESLKQRERLLVPAGTAHIPNLTEQQGKHVGRLDIKLVQLTHCQALAEHIDVTELEFEDVNDCLIALRDAWRSGHLSGSSEAGMIFPLIRANRLRYQLEGIASNAIEKLANQVDEIGRSRMTSAEWSLVREVNVLQTLPI